MAPLCPSDISPCYVRIWAAATRPPKPPLWIPACAGKTVVCAGSTPAPRASPAVASRPLRFAKGTGDHEGRPYGLNWQTGDHEGRPYGLNWQTGDHEGRPYGLNWQPSTKWSKKLGLVTPMAISCRVFRGG